MSIRVFYPYILTLIASLIFVVAELGGPLDGWWISDGYGILLEIKGDRIKAFQITAISCLADWTAIRQVEASEKDAEAVFIMTIAPDKILVKAGESADRKFFKLEGCASSVGFRRIQQRPTVCEKPTENTPLNNFDIFWTTFDEHYPFFAMRGIDWKKVREMYRPRITDKTTPRELFDILKAMVEPLHDAHVFIRGPSLTQRFKGFRENVHPVDEKTVQKTTEIIEANYLHAKLRSWCTGRVSYGLLPGSIGYLRITAFSDYKSRSNFDGNVKALDEALDECFQGGDKLRGLIIDVRINHGGSDVLGVAVASRFTTTNYLAFAKKARNDPNDPRRFTALQETLVPVSTRPHFHGKIVLLTSGATISAGETFTMALMGRTPEVIRVGENTQGVFSDVLGRKLPNGLGFGLPNEIFLTKDGTSYDGPGIPPHDPCPVYPQDDLEKGRDGCLEKAKEILKGGD